MHMPAKRKMFNELRVIKLWNITRPLKRRLLASAGRTRDSGNVPLLEGDAGDGGVHFVRLYQLYT